MYLTIGQWTKVMYKTYLNYYRCFLNYRLPQIGPDGLIAYVYFPKHFAILFILIIALYTCIPLPPSFCIITGVLVSIAHFATLVAEYVIVTNKNNEEEENDETSEYTSYMFRLVSNFYLSEEGNKLHVCYSYVDWIWYLVAINICYLL